MSVIGKKWRPNNSHRVGLLSSFSAYFILLGFTKTTKRAYLMTKWFAYCKEDDKCQGSEPTNKIIKNEGGRRMQRSRLWSTSWCRDLSLIGDGKPWPQFNDKFDSRRGPAPAKGEIIHYLVSSSTVRAELVRRVRVPACEQNNVQWSELRHTYWKVMGSNTARCSLLLMWKSKKWIPSYAAWGNPG